MIGLCVLFSAALLTALPLPGQKEELLGLRLNLFGGFKVKGEEIGTTVFWKMGFCTLTIMKFGTF